jgi:hypothetical protein
MVILRATSIMGGQKEDKGMICSIPPRTKWNTKKQKKKNSQDHWKWKNKDKNGNNKMETSNFT